MYSVRMERDTKRDPRGIYDALTSVNEEENSDLESTLIFLSLSPFPLPTPNSFQLDLSSE